jgi:hypothetical protein
MPRKKSTKVKKIRMGRVARPRGVDSGKKGTKQIVNIYVTPSGTYATPIRSATVSEPPVVIPQQPSIFQPVFPQQQFQQSQYPFTIGAQPVSPRQEAEPVPMSSSQQFLESLNLQRQIAESQKPEPQIAEPLTIPRSKQYIERKRDQFERQKKEFIVPTKKS